MNQTDYFIMRKRKRIKLSEVAEYVDCSISLLSRYENLQVAMDTAKIKKYEKFILEY